MERQLLQDTELRGSELYEIPVAPNLPLLEINLDIPKALRPCGARHIGPIGAAEHPPNPAHKVTHTAWITEVILRRPGQRSHLPSVGPRLTHLNTHTTG